MKTILQIVLAVALVSAAFGADEYKPDPDVYGSLGTAEPEKAAPGAIDVAKSANLTTLVAAVEAAGLTATLNDPAAERTIFAPTNEAFAATLKALKLTAAQLLADKPTLTRILSYHVVPKVAAKAASLKNGQVLPTLLPAPATLKVKLSSAGVEIVGATNTVKVVKADVAAGKTIVHVINGVLLPPAAKPAAKTAAKTAAKSG